MKSKRRKAFTLVELLVAIAIIGVLSVLGYSLYSVAKRAARNTAREAALTELSGFLQDYETRFRKKPSTYAVNSSNFYVSLDGEKYYFTKIPGLTELKSQTGCTCTSQGSKTLTFIYSSTQGNLGVCLEPSGKKMIEGCE